jgi:hypothetical protein
VKTISLREFQLNPTSFLSDLPLTLTRYGRAFLLVSSIAPEVTPSTEKNRCSYPDCPSVDTSLYEVEIDFEIKDFYLCKKHGKNANRKD